MDDDIEIQSIIEQNLAEYQVEMGKCLPGSTIVEDGESVWIVTNTPFSMYNGVFQSRFDESNALPTISGIMEEFKHRKRPITWMLGPSSKPDNLAQHLIHSGFQHYEDEPGMHLDMSSMNDDVPLLGGFELRVVETDAQLKDWISVWCFDAPQTVVSELLAIHHQFGYDSHRWRYYLGLLDGEPVATSLLFRGSAAAAVHWVVTIPEARRRGIGAIMTVAALRDAQLEGYKQAILTASPFGERIYQRIGFRSYCTISKYTWKPNPEADAGL